MEDCSKDELTILFAYYNGDIANDQISKKYGVKGSRKIDDIRSSLRKKNALEPLSYNSTSNGSIKFDNGLGISDIGKEILREYDLI
ncbi:hypothetical protein [uncultured Oscillibacter sp.]|uniref:hypothetical protein n=1 Tax=uncultured Oscillibacter sp. TaxID=876091 RepID=UPI0025DDF6E4|nr:hypothetical protein [uncultured Oscillibacter sp.]